MVHTTSNKLTLFAVGALCLLAFAAVPGAHARLGGGASPQHREGLWLAGGITKNEMRLQAKVPRSLQGGLLGSVGEGVGQGLGDKLGSLVGGAIEGKCGCAHGDGALGTCKPSSFFAGNGGLQKDCTKQSSKDACQGQENLLGNRFCKWTPSELSKDLGPLGKLLLGIGDIGLQRRLASNEVAETNAVGNILETMTKEVGDITEKMGYEVKDGIENSIREVGNAKRGRELSKKKCGNAAGQAACITACASVALIPLCLSDACYGPNGPDFSPECAAKTPFEPFARKGDKWGPMAGYYDKNPDFCKTLVPSKSPFCPGKLVGHCKDDDAECITCCKKVMVQSYADATTSVMGGMGR